MMALVEAGWSEGRWLRAERQTAGKGRLGRDWRSPEGNLYTSTMILPHPGDPAIGGLGLLVGVALCEAIRTAVPASGVILKWPNDIMVEHAKLAGILLERSGDAVIVGIGVNVRTAPALADRLTIALSDLAGGTDVTAVSLLEMVADRFDLWLERWRRDGFAAVRDAWLASAHPVGTGLMVSTVHEKALSGEFLGLGADGALILGLDDGTQHVIHSGDVGFL
jgi:BirA family biotin operon repressor/biotin-[acetyl-CoA-carboxylase] ligase